MGAEFAAFAPLAFIQTRPPWALERKPQLADPAIHRLAAQMVQHLTIRREHLSERPRRRLARGRAGRRRRAAVDRRLLLALAAGICVACVVGRYHYIVDVVAGAAVALALWLRRIDRPRADGPQ